MYLYFVNRFDCDSSKHYNDPQSLKKFFFYTNAFLNDNFVFLVQQYLRLVEKPDYKDNIAPKTRPLKISPENIDGDDAMMNSLSKLKYAKMELMILRTPLTKDVITSENVNIFMYILYKFCGTKTKTMWNFCIDVNTNELNIYLRMNL